MLLASRPLRRVLSHRIAIAATALSLAWAQPMFPSPVAWAAETTQSLIETGQRKFGQGDLAGALSAFAAAVQKSPADAQPLILRGSVYQKLGKLPEAEADLRAALRLNPKLPNAFDVRAELAAILADSKRPKDAAELLEQLLRENPRHADSLYNLGLSREALGDFPAAAAAYARAVREKPSEPDLRLALAGAQRKAGRHAEALAAAQEALTLAQRLSAPAPLQAQLHDEIGLSQRRLNDLKAAEASFRAALTRLPTMNVARLHLCTTLAAAGRCADALREAAGLPTTAPFAEQVAKLRAGCAKK